MINFNVEIDFAVKTIKLLFRNLSLFKVMLPIFMGEQNGEYILKKELRICRID